MPSIMPRKEQPISWKRYASLSCTPDLTRNFVDCCACRLYAKDSVFEREGSLTALAFVLIIGRAERFQCGKQIASYLGLVPSEDSSGDRRRLGHISKQGNALLRFLLLEAAQVKIGRAHV